MTIRTTLITSSLIAAAGTFAFAHPTEVVAGPVTTYTIDRHQLQNDEVSISVGRCMLLLGRAVAKRMELTV